MRFLFLFLLLSLSALAQNSPNQSICQNLLTNDLQTAAIAIARSLEPSKVPNKPIVLESYASPIGRFYKLEVGYRNTEIVRTFDVYTPGMSYKFQLIKKEDTKILAEMEQAREDNLIFLNLFKETSKSFLPDGAVILDCYVSEFVGNPPKDATAFFIKVFYRYRLPNGNVIEKESESFIVKRSLDRRVPAQ